MAIYAIYDLLLLLEGLKKLLYFHRKSVVCYMSKAGDKYLKYSLLRPPYVIGGTLYFCPVVSIFYLSIFFSSPNLSGRKLDVYHTSTHGVALVRI